MAPCTVAFGIKGPLAIVADSAKLPGVDFVHGDGYGSLLHLREHSTVMALFAFNASLLVHCTIEFHSTHGAFVEFNGLLRWDCEGDTGTQEQDCNDQNGESMHGCFLLGEYAQIVDYWVSGVILTG